MRRRGIQIPPVVLDILAVVAFVTGEAKRPFLQDRVATVPERERQAQELVLVADAAEAVLTPAISA
jgi:hypothetical protein